MDYKKISQVAIPEEQETFIHIDYASKTIRVYTSKATVMRRMLKAGYTPDKYNYLRSFGDSPVDMTWTFPSSDLGKFLRTKLFKFD